MKISFPLLYSWKEECYTHCRQYRGVEHLFVEIIEISLRCSALPTLAPKKQLSVLFKFKNLCDSSAAYRLVVRVKIQIFQNTS